MKKLILVGLLASTTLLGGCAAQLEQFKTTVSRVESAITVATTATVPAPTAQVAISSFQVLEAASTGYFKYCAKSKTDAICAPGTVANPGPLRLVIKYVRQGRVARDQIKAAGKSGALISTTAYTLLTTAITNLSASPAASFGVSK